MKTAKILGGIANVITILVGIDLMVVGGPAGIVIGACGFLFGCKRLKMKIRGNEGV